MSDPVQNVKPAVRALSAYTLAAYRAPVKLNQNENPWELPDEVRRRIVERALAQPWSRYPDFDPRELLGALSRFAGWPADGILAGNGSNELIEAMLLVTVGPGVRVAIPEPTFTLYALLTGILGGDLVRVPLAADLEYDLDALVSEAERSAVTVVCSPNNPTGGVVTPEAVERLCRSTRGLVVIDEAYHEFSGRTVVPLLQHHPNLVVLRTFSKAMALAGLRLGYLMASPALVREIDKARLPYNINVFSQTAALVLLEDDRAVRETVSRLVEERERLAARLAALPGVKVYPSQANFLLIELAQARPADVFAAVYAEGVLIRNVSSYPRLDRCLRVSVGTPDENQRLLEALRRALVQVPARQNESIGVQEG
jgi:histidinol-phosphate aminotransferase